MHVKKVIIMGAAGRDFHNNYFFNMHGSWVILY
jgi:predicted GTPase